MGTPREQRLAENEAMFRTANERMAEWEEHHINEAEELYFCECADPECRQKVPLQRSDYEQVRANPCHFFIAPGHEIPDVETVIETRQEWVVIEKDPEVREIVEATALRQR